MGGGPNGSYQEAVSVEDRADILRSVQAQDRGVSFEFPIGSLVPKKTADFVGHIEKLAC